jgi:hypothetical protein
LTVYAGHTADTERNRFQICLHAFSRVPA